MVPPVATTRTLGRTRSPWARIGLATPSITTTAINGVQTRIMVPDCRLFCARHPATRHRSAAPSGTATAPGNVRRDGRWYHRHQQGDEVVWTWDARGRCNRLDVHIVARSPRRRATATPTLQHVRRRIREGAPAAAAA